MGCWGPKEGQVIWKSRVGKESSYNYSHPCCIWCSWVASGIFEAWNLDTWYWQSEILEYTKSMIFFRDIQQQILGLSIAMSDCAEQVILVVLCLSLSKHCSAKCGICCCGSQDMLMVVDLVIIACGYAELILGEWWRPSQGELMRSRYSPLKGLG